MTPPDPTDALIELLWGSPTSPDRGPKRSLSLDQIAAATVRLADAEGLAQVSMQRVAADLGVTKMALYRYVRSKEELLAITVEEAVEVPPDLSAVAGGWRVRVETWAALLRDVWLRHPWLPVATVGDRVMGPREVGWIEAAVNALAETGLTVEEQLDSVLVLCGLVRSSTAPGAVGTQPWTVSDRAGRALRARLDQRRSSYPALIAATAGSAQTSAPVGEQGWAFGMRLVLDGLEKLTVARAADRWTTPMT